jgi:hypothetical protein
MYYYFVMDGANRYKYIYICLSIYIYIYTQTYAVSAVHVQLNQNKILSYCRQQNYLIYSVTLKIVLLQYKISCLTQNIYRNLVHMFNENVT